MARYDSPYLRRVDRAANERRSAEQRKRQATGKLRAALQEAQEAGETVTDLAQVSGLSRQGVYDLLAAERSS